MAKRHTIIGLDIGQHSIKAAWVSWRGDSPMVTRTASLQIPLGERNPDRLIRPWIEANGIARQGCVLGVAGVDSVFQTFQLSPDDPRKPPQAAAMEVAKFNDIASEQMSYGVALHAPREGASGASVRRMLLMMAKPSVLDGALARANALGLHVRDMVPGPCALYNASRMAAGGTNKGQVDILINVGHTNTDVVVGAHEGLLFCRSFRNGGAQVSEALRQAGGMSVGQADTFKMTRVGRDTLDDQTLQQLEGAMALWEGEIKTCIAAYHHQIRDQTLAPARIILCGGAALLYGLRERLEATSGLPVVMAGDVWRRFVSDKPELFAEAAGLAISGLEAAPVRVSMLPEYVRHELVFREKKPFWIASGVAVALTFVLIIVGGVRAIGRQSKALMDAERTVNELQRITEDIEAYESAMRMLRARSKPIMALLSMGPRYRELINLVSESLDSQDWIAMICDEYSYYAPEPSEQAQRPAPIRAITPGMRDPRVTPPQQKEVELKPPPELPVRFIVEGYTPKDNLITVKALIDRLTASELVLRADLIYDDQMVPPDRFRTWSESLQHSHFVVLVEMEPL